ncbi:hypothetical protein [Gorillibacterium sp. sgz5001074]|uniref:hypothetical protein n=1 Tax=Gorillibacterium sp. sgz5001074 TaxID=3446695 RepID=UPI003F67D63F
MKTLSKWAKGFSAVVIAAGLMAGCSAGKDSPADTNPLEGKTAPSGKTVPSDGTGTGASAQTSSPNPSSPAAK